VLFSTLRHFVLFSTLRHFVLFSTLRHFVLFSTLRVKAKATTDWTDSSRFAWAPPLPPVYTNCLLILNDLFFGIYFFLLILNGLFCGIYHWCVLRRVKEEKPRSLRGFLSLSTQLP
jgi:hypothetical protein